MDGKSLNIAEDKIQQLKQLFPEVFAEDKIDFDKLKLILGEETLAKEERYELNWAGKYDSFKEIQKQTTATLIPDPENSIDFDTSENIFIEGENLEALRVLQKSYYGKIKMIYIDPPYNTGNDSFVYPDDYTERRSEYEERTGIKDEDGFLNKQDLWKKNTKENGQFHSVWLSMMYPRLFLARNLMREDGVIFVSIDDNEVDNLKLLMDMVFGEENFIATLAVQLNPRGRNLDKFIAKTHESVIIFAKNMMEETTMYGLKKEGKMVSEYNKNDGKRGAYRLIGLRNRNQAFNPTTRPKLFYPLYVRTSDGAVSLERNSEFTEEVLPKTAEGVETCWTWGMNKVKQENHLLVAEISAERWRIFRKDYLYDENGNSAKTLPKSVWVDKEINNDYGKKSVKNLLGSNIMDFPKSSFLIGKMIKASTSSQDIILDFFAGSGTTAHSVLNLNQEDNGNRKFICVQMPEPTPKNSEAKKAGYDTISQISQARIKKVIEQIKAEQEGKLDFDKDHPQDLGFKSFKLAPSNFKTWRSDAEGEALAEQLALFQSPYKEGTEQENMLYELLLKAGFPLTVPIQKENVEGIALYIVDGGKMLLSLEAINEKVLDYVLEVKPQRFVTLDKLFGKDDQLLTNTRLQLQEMGVDFQVI
ncbi:site-specific DNA-methyltransferase [Aureispira sp. CCB-E]|uniref:site-specific DNA-methyltransferase n=1 Tax=Aureispira sp. CCB-E TaxID=3051121 RepID=UPI0028692A01|nr:site-specific DNA-methyltransferase [Aureispira sp. CCB-E]WMX16580.1 site-specific DNA-methyltransferase [Aureispira sp. CCB-E]